jgi:hypothetical protein
MSRYHTLYNADAAKFTTLQTNATTSVKTSITGRRITVLTIGAHFMAMGTSTVTATTSSCVIPNNSYLDFNMTTGTHVAFLSHAGAAHVTIIDAD